LASNNVVLSTLQSGTNAGDIFVNANVSWSTVYSLTLSAYHDILFMSGSKVTSTGPGNLVLRADNTGTGQGTVVFNSGGHVDYTQSTGTVSIFYNPSGSPASKYQNPTNYFCPPCPGGGGVFVNVNQPSQLTAYMLVNNGTDLQNVSTNVGGTYALGRNIDAGSIANFTPIQNFTGLFDGQGQTIATLTIASTAQNVGLFGTIASAGEVRNLNLTNVSVNSSASSQLVGTLAGTNAGTISNVSASGAVSSTGANSTVGGLVGANAGSITDSTASVAVSSTGANSTVGGLAGVSTGTIADATASGAVTSTGADSTVGGLVGVSTGIITDSTASGAVTSTGANSTVGGLVGANAGTIADSTASGAVTSTGANSTVGALVGTNTGTITNSTGSGVVTSTGANSTVTGGVVSNLPAIPSNIAGCSDPLCGFINTAILPPSTATFPPAAFFESLPGPVQVINNLVGIGPSQLAALNAAAPAVFNTVQGGIRLPPQQQPPGPAGPQQGQQQQLPTGFDRRVIDIPPPTETRFVKDEVVLQIAGNVTVEQLQAAVGRLGLTLLASENLAITGSTVVRFRITNGRSPAEIIRALTAIQLVAVAQPNYLYTLQQQPSDPVPASRGDATQGDPAQYMLEKLQISDIHRLVRGANVPIAVIDSEIDVTHPDLEGAVTRRFDAVGAPEKPHAHGTGMAGAIAAHRRLLGTAPAARLLAVHAFSTTAATAESTTFNILKGINWSVQEGVRIINMSFAGPRDPSLERALKAAYDKGIVLIAAAGNAGPKSPPLFPAAIPFVIAVTATDVDDKLFTAANRGKYISVAAPGVDILVPAPEGEYQMTTGTSVAAAEVSGIVALLLERNPKLTPADIRRILTASAKRLAPGERDNNFGSGLIDPLKALQLADPHTAASPPAPTLQQR
jgi:subtilisin family serine protease